MNPIWLLICEEFKSTTRNVVTVILLNLLGTFLLYVAFISGLKMLLPRINFVDISHYMVPGIVSFLVATLVFGLSSLDIWRMTNLSGLIEQLRTTTLTLFQIHLGKSLSYILKGLIHAIISGIFLLILTGFSIQFEYMFFYFIFFTVGIIFIIQLGIIFGVIIKKQTSLIYITVLIVCPLFLLSGLIVPSNYYPEVAKQVICCLPTTAIIEGGRELLLNHSLNYIYIIYIVIFDILTFIVSFFVFRRNMER